MTFSSILIRYQISTHQVDLSRGIVNWSGAAWSLVQVLVNLRHSEKATQFDNITHLFWRYCVNVKTSGRLFQILWPSQKTSSLIIFLYFNLKPKQFLKFIYFEKATKFCEISTVDLSYVVPVKSTVEISQNVVAFSEYMNFKK